MITMQELKELNKSLKSIKAVEMLIEDLKTTTVSDLTGNRPRTIVKEMNRLNYLKARVTELMEKVDAVEDPLARTLFELKYVQGWTFRAVSMALYGTDEVSYSKNAILRKLQSK